MLLKQKKSLVKELAEQCTWMQEYISAFELGELLQENGHIPQNKTLESSGTYELYRKSINKADRIIKKLLEE